MSAARMEALMQKHEHGEKRKHDACGSITAPAPLAIDVNSSVLNAANDGALKSVLSFPAVEGSAPLKSDADEQLLVSLTLPSISKLSAIKIAGPADGTAPATIKLFANKQNMSFDDCEDYPATQTLTLTGGAATLPLQLTKFLSVSSLTVFVESNQGDEEATCLSRLEVIGVPVHTTNMNDLKKVG